MNSTPCVLRLLALVAAGLALSVTGCQNPFVAKHKVLVDAISAPGALKPSGQSYRLVAKSSVVSTVPVQVPVLKACLDAALGSVGMFEAPPNGPPDVVIEVGYGQDTAARVDPAARETFLQLSARGNPGKAVDKATGGELWDVRVAVLGIPGRIETAMPILCSVAVSYIATDTHAETRVEIPKNSPMIAAVRETAIKSLDAKTQLEPPPETASPASGAGVPGNPSSAAPAK